METLADILKFSIPASLVLYAIYATTKLFFEKQFDEKKIVNKAQNSALITPLRLQAYERMVLFLERISPNNILIRTNGMAEQVLDYQQMLLREIREESNHNITQQIYISPEAWDKTILAKDSLIAMINTAAAALPPDAPAIDLAKKIFENTIQQEPLPTNIAISYLKNEVQTLFF